MSASVVVFVSATLQSLLDPTFEQFLVSFVNRRDKHPLQSDMCLINVIGHSTMQLNAETDCFDSITMANNIPLSQIVTRYACRRRSL